jgi:hypothetical protein
LSASLKGRQFFQTGLDVLLSNAEVLKLGDGPVIGAGRVWAGRPATLPPRTFDNYPRGGCYSWTKAPLEIMAGRAGQPPRTASSHRFLEARYSRQLLRSAPSLWQPPRRMVFEARYLRTQCTIHNTQWAADSVHSPYTAQCTECTIYIIYSARLTAKSRCSSIPHWGSTTCFSQHVAARILNSGDRQRLFPLTSSDRPTDPPARLLWAKCTECADRRAIRMPVCPVPCPDTIKRPTTQNTRDPPTRTSRIGSFLGVV